MRGPLSIARTPYAVMVWVDWGAGAQERTAVTHLKHLGEARAYVRRLTYAWSRLVGGFRSPVAWYVRDERDGSEYHLSNLTRRDTSNGKQEDGPQRLW